MSEQEPRIEICPTTKNDWQQLKAVRLEALELEPQAFGGKLEQEQAYPDAKWQEIATQTAKNRLLFVQVDGALAGMGGLYVKDAAVNIWGMYVRKEYRGLGIGKLLLEALMQEAKKMGYEKVSLGVRECQTIACMLYNSLGFKAMGEEVEDGQRRLLMEKIF